MNRANILLVLPLLTLPILPSSADAGRATPLPFRAPARLADVAELPPPSAVHLDGYLGRRVANNEKNRLLAVDEAALVAGFRHRPGQQAWIGEHVGKWLHAATLAWAYTGDPVLKTKLDRVAAALIKTQDVDGYLGTYIPGRRFGLYPGADWDVWVHKYDLIGLLTYYQYTRNPAALEAARRVGDLLDRTFGPGKKSILSAGTHVGMAATSVLEPIVLLYRITGEARYLEFARYLVRAWDEPRGPKILTTLTREKSVYKTANGKAYEMLSNLVGLCELARATGEREYLDPAVNAWEDIVAHRLYLTGTASSHEHFTADFELPNQPGANVGETCVTVTWIQLNAQLLRLTGDARYGDELERSYYNHLAAAQRPDGAEWCYYTALEGTKPYGPGINCCVSSGPRGMALAPQLAYLKVHSGRGDGVAINLFEASRAVLRLGGEAVTIEQRSGFPRSGSSVLTFHMRRPSTFAVRVRSPQWAHPLTLQTKDYGDAVKGPDGGWAELPPRRWREGDRVRVEFNLSARMIKGEHTNAGRAALMWGPLVLAYDEPTNASLPSAAALALSPLPDRPPVSLLASRDAELKFAGNVRSARDGAIRTAAFVPFSAAGSGGGCYRVWLAAPGSGGGANGSLLAFGHESRSRAGNVVGEITDGDPTTFVVTFDDRPASEDWFAVSVDAPVTIRRIVFMHGRSFHDGGWFDTSGGKPRVQIQRQRGAAWETVGTLDAYPATTATDSGGLKDGQPFTLRLPEPQSAIAVRVVGRPAYGDNSRQAFASCSELQSFAD